MAKKRKLPGRKPKAPRKKRRAIRPPPVIRPEWRELGLRLKAARARTGLSAYAVARTMGVSQQYVSRMEGGETSVSTRQLNKYAWAIGVDPGDLVRGMKPHGAG